MAGTSLVDVEAWLAERRSHRETHERAIAEHQEALAAIDGDLAALERIKTFAMSPPSAAPARRRNAPPPRLASDVERLSDEVKAALAEEVRGMVPLDALVHVVGRIGEVQAADALRVLAAAGVVNAKRSVGNSYVHKLLTASGHFVSVGGGRYRLRVEVTAIADASENVQDE